MLIQVGSIQLNFEYKKYSIYKLIFVFGLNTIVNGKSLYLNLFFQNKNLIYSFVFFLFLKVIYILSQK